MSGGDVPQGWSNPITVIAGERQRVSAAELLPSRRDLWQNRIDQQLQLIQSGQHRRSPIIVTPAGVIVDGHHAVRAAAELGESVDVLVQNLSVRAVGLRIQELPVR